MLLVKTFCAPMASTFVSVHNNMRIEQQAVQMHTPGQCRAKQAVIVTTEQSLQHACPHYLAAEHAEVLHAKLPALLPEACWQKL